MVTSNREMLILLKRAGVKLRRDVIYVATGDEESGGAGIKALLKHDPSLAEAGLVINEGGGVINNGPGTAPIFSSFEVAQKIYQDFTLATVGKTGHSALPPRDNAISRLSRALERLDGRQRCSAALLDPGDSRLTSKRAQSRRSAHAGASDER